MKKILTSILLLGALTATAQTTNTLPNRMLVNHNWSYDGFQIDKVDSITFKRVDGDVRADATFLKYSKNTNEAEGDTVWVNVKKTPSCVSYNLDIIPKVMSTRYTTDGDIERMFKANNAQKYYEDFTNGQITGSGWHLSPGSDYTVVTMGYDEYGVACQASRADFTTPSEATVGTPSVTYTIDDIQPTSFTLTVTPNKDCAAFYWCEFNAGEAEAQYNQWGAMFGFNNMGDMIRMWSGQGYSAAATNTWNQLLPKHDYEVYVLPTDANGTYGDLVVIPVTTTAAGGPGTATVDITVGDFGGDAKDGYWQYLAFTPNDQVNIHHDLLITKEYFDANFTDASIADSLKKDVNPFNPYDTYWDQVGVDEGRWNSTPSTAYYALSIAKNINDEWGPLAKKEFTTPASASAKVPYAPKAIAPRLNVKAAKKTAVAPAANFGKINIVEAAK